MITVLTPAKSGDLTRIDVARAELGVAEHGEDERIAALIKQASAIVARRADRTFGKETLSETIRLGMPSAELMLARFPVTSVTSIVEDGDTLNASDYELDAESAMLTRIDDDAVSAWPAAKIVVSYEAGYDLPDNVPQEIEQAALVVLKHLYFGTARDPAARAEVIDGAGSTTYSDTAVMAQVDELVSDHRVPNIG
jgi:uncharacterized phiE125 gp8 family phage protein